MPPLSLGDRVRQDEPLARHTTFRIGGIADFFIRVESEEALVAAVRWSIEEQLPYLILGGGSNVLVADAGFRGIVIANRARGWWRRARGVGVASRFRVASCVPFSQLARRTIRSGLAGLEWAVGIPGTVGGAIVGNAGAHGGCVADNLTSVQLLDSVGELRDVKASALALAYRSSALRETMSDARARATIVSAEFVLEAGGRSDMAARAEEYQQLRRQRQPKGPSAGSVFANPSGDHAGRLIEAAGLKGTVLGGAQISPVHANFIVNRGGATSADVLSLMVLIGRTVKDRFGVTLRPELTLVGDWRTHAAELEQLGLSRS